MDERNLLDKPRSVIVIPNLNGIQQTCLSGSHRELGSKQNWPLQSQNYSNSPHFTSSRVPRASVFL